MSHVLVFQLYEGVFVRDEMVALSSPREIRCLRFGSEGERPTLYAITVVRAPPFEFLHSFSLFALLFLVFYQVSYQACFYFLALHQVCINSLCCSHRKERTGVWVGGWVGDEWIRG